MSQPRLLLMDLNRRWGWRDYHSADFRHHRGSCREQGMTIFLVEQNANQRAPEAGRRGYVLEKRHVVLEDTATPVGQNEAVRSAYLGGLISSNPASLFRGL